MASLKYCDKHNQVGFLKKPEESAGFAEIVDFLKGSHIRYALTHNPTIHDSLVKQFWQTATASTLADRTLELRATIDTLEYTITEASVRSKLQLADASGISMLLNTEIFEGMGNMGYPTDGSFTFWKSFFTPQWRFLVHHILHCISPKSGGWDQFGSNIATALICLSTGRVYNFSKLIFDGMVANLKSQADQVGTQSQPSSSIVPPSPTYQLAPTESTTIPSTPINEPTFEPSSPPTAPEHETMEHPFEQPSPEYQPSSPRQESDIPQTQAPTHTHEVETGHMSVDDLFQLVPQLMTRIESLENDLKQTKQTMGNAIVKLVKKVKNLEKGRNLQKDESEVFETPKQGKSSGETDIKSASEKVSSGGEYVSASQREGKAVLEETPHTKRTKKQIRKEQASLAEIARIQAEDEAENARREELKRQDELAAKRLQEELELSEAQKKRMAQIAGEDVFEADYAQRMVGLISQRRKLIAEQKAKAQREKPMTQAQQRQEDVSVPKEKDKESVKREEGFEIKKPVLRYTKRKSLARKGLQRKLESAKSGTEEDVEAYMKERVDEPSSEEFPMSLIPQGPAPAK
ncbi:hypothetical protein Tco_1373178, partial [Tanacetum coccineum]